VALLSGGLDSGVAAALWRAEGGELALCITADYGQRAARREAAAAEALARRFGAAWRAFELPWLGDAAAAAGSAVVPNGRPLPTARGEELGDAATAAAVWVPARNLVLVAAAAAFAEALGCACVLAGFNREEAATFSDNSAEFVAAADAVLALGCRSRVHVVSPTLHLDKRAVAGKALALGFTSDDFWSCYGPGPLPCGSCESCARSRRAFAAAAS
jgi:7-cyano-7-deazaguanine synthase